MEGSDYVSSDLREILSHYMLHLHYSESFGRIHKVYTNQGVYCLKTIPPEKSMDFVKYLQRIYQRGYYRAVPVYVTADGRYGVLHKNKLYYLMPWLTNDESGERNEKHRQMFRELARIHSLTVKDIEVDKQDREIHYEKTTDEWKRQQSFVEEYIEKCEQKWYMSPFELLFCSYYYDISQAITFALRKFEEWYEKTKDEETVRSVIIHGKFSLQHFLLDERGSGYFVNFENSKQLPQHFDLLPFFVKYCNTYPIRCDECVDWLYYYYKFFAMREEEMLLYISYLAYPSIIFQTIEMYHTEKYERKTEAQYVMELQKNYWQLKNIEYFVMKIEEIEAQKKAAKEAAEQSEQS